MRFLLVAAMGLALLAGSARAAGPLVLGFSISSGSRAMAPLSLPSAATPNAPGSISVPVSFTSAPALVQQLPVSALNVLWQRAGSTYGIPWQVLASINKIESNFGQNMGPSSAGAVGWMQFMPSTWLRWGVDADGDGVADPWNASDAIFAAARYLAAAGGQVDIARGVFAYNHADWYVREVLDLAQVYGQGGITQTVDLQHAAGEARRRSPRCRQRQREPSARSSESSSSAACPRRLHSRADTTALLSDRLAAERRAVLFDVRVDAAREATAAARSALNRRRTHSRRRRKAHRRRPSHPASGTSWARPSFHDNYVFPVGGGPQLVSVAHTHHDYPAADIAAPAGSPVYALSNAVVLNAWHTADPRCGIGMTIRTDDGLVWTYCHLAFLEPGVVDGVSLAAGAQIGLVGSTGHATGPHLHLQLQPPTEYPQNQAWFQSFAGSAFQWQDAPTPLELPDATPAAARVFSVVVPETSDPMVGFTRGGA